MKVFIRYVTRKIFRRRVIGEIDVKKMEKVHVIALTAEIQTAYCTWLPQLSRELIRKEGLRKVSQQVLSKIFVVGKMAKTFQEHAGNGFVFDAQFGNS